MYQTRGHLSGQDRRLAAGMIERPDNDATTALWNEDGKAVGIAAYDDQAGVRCTSFDPAGHLGIDAHLRKAHGVRVPATVGWRRGVCHGRT